MPRVVLVLMVVVLSCLAARTTAAAKLPAALDRRVERYTYELLQARHPSLDDEAFDRAQAVAAGDGGAS